MQNSKTVNDLIKQGHKIITYQAKTYTPEAVTGRYVRVEGRKGNYRFKVFETTGLNGQGNTLKEYLTNGADIPHELKEKCIRSKTTEKWD